MSLPVNLLLVALKSRSNYRILILQAPLKLWLLIMMMSSKRREYILKAIGDIILINYAL